MTQPKKKAWQHPAFQLGPRTVGAACADDCELAAAWTVSAGVIFCGKEEGTPYYLFKNLLRNNVQ